MVAACWISTHRDMWYAEMPFVFHILAQQYEFVWDFAWTAVQWVVTLTDGLPSSVFWL
jgi:hypothetical protein